VKYQAFLERALETVGEKKDVLRFLVQKRGARGATGRREKSFLLKNFCEGTDCFWGRPLEKWAMV